MAMQTYTKKPLSLAQFTMMRGTIDYSNAAQFNFYESGYSFLVVLSRPTFIEELCNPIKGVPMSGPEVANLLNLFCFILENEFRGLTGIEDITTEAHEFTDGINTIATLAKSVQQSNGEVTMTFTERSGAAITNFIAFYIKGAKATRTQAKTYHGLIAAGVMTGGFEHEVFNLLYIVTDNTLLGLEKAYLLLNAWPNKAQTSIYDSEKGTIEKKDVDVAFTCFVMDGNEVNRRALQMLAYINEPGAVLNYHTKMFGANNATVNAVKNAKGSANTVTVHPDADQYNYQIYDKLDIGESSRRYATVEQDIYRNSNGDNVTQRGMLNSDYGQWTNGVAGATNFQENIAAAGRR